MENEPDEERMRKMHKFLDKHDIQSLGKVGRFRIGICKQCSMPFVKYGITHEWYPITKGDGNLISAAVKLAGPKHADAIFRYAKSEDYNTDNLQMIIKSSLIMDYIANKIKGVKILWGK